MADRWTDPLVSGGVSAAASLFPDMTNVRILNETLNKGSKEPITAKDFAPEELDIIKRLVEFKGGDKGSVTYPDYLAFLDAERAAGRIGDVGTRLPSLFSVQSPYGQVQTTLGQFGFKVHPKTKEVSITDAYDFNPAAQGVNSEVVAGSGPYAMIRDLAGRKIPPGTGRVVDVRFNPLMEKSIK